MPFFKTIQWVVWKDLISEWRTRETMSSMLFFALIVILVFSFSFSMDQESHPATDCRHLFGWRFTFTGIIGLGKSFTTELQNDCLEALQMSPVPKGAIYLGKVAANFLFMFSVEILLFPLFVLFFNLDVIEDLGTLLLIFFLATLGLSTVGTLFFRTDRPNSSPRSDASRPIAALSRSRHDCGSGSHSRRPQWRPLSFLFAMDPSIRGIRYYFHRRLLLVI